MQRGAWRVAAVIAVASWGTSGASAAAESAKDVVDHYLAARGGAEKAHAARTVRLRGTIEANGGGPPAPIVIELVHPDKMRVDIQFGDKGFVHAYDGAVGWQINPFEGAPKLEILAGDDLRHASEEADDDAFVDAAEKGHKLELVGNDTIDGKPVRHLRLTLHNGDVHDYFFDATTGLKLRWQATRTISGKEVVLESRFSDFREAGGLLFPYHIDSGMQGSAPNQKLVFSSIEVNVPIDAARFAKPSAPPPSPAGAPPR